MTPPTLVDVTHAAPRPRRRRAAKFDPPAWLSKTGKAAFRRIVLDIERDRPDSLERGDVPALALLAEVYSVAQAAAKAMRGAGNEPAILDVDEAHGGGTKKSPAWMVLNQASSRYEALAKEFGLTLAARQRLELPAGGFIPDEDQDELDDALNG